MSFVIWSQPSVHLTEGRIYKKSQARPGKAPVCSVTLLYWGANMCDTLPWAHLVEQENADQNLGHVVEDEQVPELVWLAVLHVVRPPRQHKVEVSGHNGEARHWALDQKPVVRARICSSNCFLIYIYMSYKVTKYIERDNI
jgi:hypothetical protein